MLRQVSWLASVRRRRFAAMADNCITFPGAYRVVFDAAYDSLTVAGPRRIRTGFPVRPNVGT